MTWTHVRLWSEMHYDAEKTRIAATNRVGSDTVHPDLYPYIEQVEASEAWAERALIEAAWETAPDVMQWVKDTRGLGAKTMARLLGVLGHPVHAQPYHWEGTGKKRVLVADEPFDRSLRQLWAYCGVGDPEKKRRRGMSVEEAFGLGNPRCRTRLHVIAVCCMRTSNSPYRDVYEEVKARLEEVHSDWTKGHRHQAALRIVGKEVLRDLFNVAKKGDPNAPREPNEPRSSSKTSPPSKVVSAAGNRPAAGDILSGAPGGVFLAETYEEAMRLLEDSP